MLPEHARSWAALDWDIAVSPAPGGPLFGLPVRPCAWLLPKYLFSAALKPPEAPSTCGFSRASRCTATEVSAPFAAHCPSRCSAELFLCGVLASAAFSASRCSLTACRIFRLFFLDFLSCLFACGSCQTTWFAKIPESHFRNYGFRPFALFALRGLQLC